MVAARTHPIALAEIGGAPGLQISVGASILCNSGIFGKSTTITFRLAGIVMVSTSAHPISLTKLGWQAIMLAQTRGG